MTFVDALACERAARHDLPVVRPHSVQLQRLRELRRRHGLRARPSGVRQAQQRALTSVWALRRGAQPREPRTPVEASAMKRMCGGGAMGCPHMSQVLLVGEHAQRRLAQFLAAPRARASASARDWALPGAFPRCGGWGTGEEGARVRTCL